MGKYAVGSKIYVLADVTAVDRSDDTKYKVKTHNGIFYVKESTDTLVSSATEDLSTSELYSIMEEVNNLSNVQFNYMFTLWNLHSGDNFNYLTLNHMLSDKNMTFDKFVEIYKYYKANTTAAQINAIETAVNNQYTNNY